MAIKPDLMKIIYASALIGLFLLLGAGEVTGQRVTGEKKPNRQEQITGSALIHWKFPEH